MQRRYGAMALEYQSLKDHRPSSKEQELFDSIKRLEEEKLGLSISLGSKQGELEQALKKNRELQDGPLYQSFYRAQEEFERTRLMMKKELFDQQARIRELK